MRLLIADGDPTEIQEALSHLDAPGASVLIKPQWITPDPSEKLWVACGAPAVKLIQSAGWIPNKGGVEANRGKLFTGVKPDGWTSEIAVGITYAPQIRNIDYPQFVHLQCDIAGYRRYEATGTMQPKLGKYTYVSDLTGVIDYCKRVHEATGEPVELALDTETEGLDPFNPNKNIVCIQLSAKEGISDVIYTLDMSWDYIQKTIIPQLQWLVSQPWIKTVGANLKYDMLWLRVKWAIVVENFTFDTCNGGSLCEENRNNTLNLHTKVYSPELGGYDDEFNRTHDKSKMGEVPKADLLPYAGGDTDACLRNYRKIRKELISDNMTPSGKPAKNSLASVYIHIVHPTLKALHKMEYNGVCVDVDKFHAFGADLENRMNESMAMAAAVMPKALIEKYGGLTETGGAPLSKPNMIAEFLFSPTGLNLKPLQVTEKTSKPSTSEYHLSQFKDHPEASKVIERYLDYKSVSKMHGTYYKGFLSHLRADNKWHPSYIIHRQGGGKDNEQDAAGTVTGRGSATAPAFQCVTGDAEILTKSGVRTAASIIDPILPDGAYNPFVKHTMPIWGSEGWQDTSNIFKSWRADLMRIRFVNGNELKCTPEHPIRIQGAGWIRAKDVHTGHYYKIPKKHERAPMPLWCNRELATVLGIIAGAGRITADDEKVQFEIPAEFGVGVHDALGQNCIIGSLEYIGPLAILTFDPMASVNRSYNAMTFFMALPGKGSPSIAYDLRGTEAIYPFLNGFFRTNCEVIGEHTPTNDRRRCISRVTSRELALALLRETSMEGLNPPYIRQKEDHWQIRWGCFSAANMLDKAGLLPEGWPVDMGGTNPKEKKMGLRVSSVESADPGYVYDFTVPTTHDFYANGILVHNTVPKHSYWGKRLRECIVAPDGYVIVARDYSQGELKVAACWAGEQKMIQAYKNGIDLHTLTAATVNGMSYEEAMFLKKNDAAAYDILRQNGKAGNFGLLYGMSAYGFMMYADAVYGVKLTLEEAEAMRNAFFDLYPMLPMWHDRQINEARIHGMVRSPLGRLRHLPTINSPIKKVRETTQNQAINSPIQGTLVDMMWWSMGIIEQEAPSLLLPFGQVHDQGLWYSPEDQVDAALKLSGSVMENLPFHEKFGWKPELTFNTDAEVGYNLAELKKVAA